MAGRKQKYFTDEEKRLANNSKSQKYYSNNANIVKEKNLQTYYAKKSGK